MFRQILTSSRSFVKPKNNLFINKSLNTSFLPSNSISFKNGTSVAQYSKTSFNQTLKNNDLLVNRFNKNQYKNNNNNYRNTNQQGRKYGSSFQNQVQQNQNSVLMGVAASVLLLGSGYYLFKYVNQPHQVYGKFEGGEAASQYVGRNVRDSTSYEFNTIPKKVQEYMYHTYKYVLAGLGVTTAAAVAGFQSGLVFRIMSMNPWVSLGVFGLGTIGTMMITRSIDPRNTVAKHLSFGAFNALVGLSLCSLGFFNPAILVRAGLYTLGLFSGLSFVAMNAKEEKFLNYGGPLLAGLIVVALAGFAPLFLPARFAGTIGVMEKVWLYGGLLVFGGFILFDTQRLMLRAKQYHSAKETAIQQYGPNVNFPQADYIANSIGIYLNIINIFIRLVMILQNSQNRKR